MITEETVAPEETVESQQYTQEPTWCRSTVIRQVVDHIHAKHSIYLDGDPGSGKTNLIDNVIRKYIQGERSKPIDEAYQKVGMGVPRRPKIDFTFFDFKPSASKKFKEYFYLIIANLAKKSGMEGVLLTIKSRATLHEMFEVYKSLIREYCLEQNIEAYYIIFDNFDLTNDTLEFLRALKDLQFIVCFEDLAPEEYWKLPYAQKQEYIKLPSMSSDEVEEMSKRYIARKNIHLPVDVYSQFIHQIKTNMLGTPREIINEINKLMGLVLQFGFRLSIKDIIREFPQTTSKLNTSSKVIVHLVFCYMGMSFLAFAINNSFAPSPVQLLGGSIIVWLWIWNISDRKDHEGKRINMRSR